MLAIVLGSGLSGFSEYFENTKIESFESLFNTSFETLDGHERKFIWCQFEDVKFLVISGKLHYYEGHGFSELITPIRYAIDNFGIDEVLVTSASGGLGEGIINGEWTHIDKIVSIPEVNLGFPINCNSKEQVIKQEEGILYKMPQVTYAYHQGPSLGTNAEYRMLHSLGVDLVGMSMYPEYCFLKSVNVKSHFMSIPVCNYYPFESLEEANFAEVIEISSAGIPKLVDIFKDILSIGKTETCQH